MYNSNFSAFSSFLLKLLFRLLNFWSLNTWTIKQEAHARHCVFLYTHKTSSILMNVIYIYMCKLLLLSYLFRPHLLGCSNTHQWIKKWKKLFHLRGISNFKLWREDFIISMVPFAKGMYADFFYWTLNAQTILLC